jgi:uncharacterized protein YkvS
MSVFIGQDWLPLVLETNIDVSATDVQEIIYWKPSGATGVWDSVSDNVTVENLTDLKRQFVDGDIDEVGIWKFQAHVVVTATSRNGYGDIVSLDVLPAI